MRTLTSNERSLIRRKVVDGLRVLGVEADPIKPVVLTASNKNYLAGQIVDGLHKLGHSAEITPELMDREARWMTDELRSAGVTFMPFAIPPDPYRAALDLRQADAPHRRAWPCGCEKVVTLDANGIPDPYAAGLAKMTKEQR